MGTLEGLGFRIFRLRQAKETSEYIIYDIKNDNINYYSKNRCTTMLRNEIRDRGVKMKALIREHWELGERDKIESKDISKFLTGIINDELELIDNIAFRPMGKKIFKHNEKIYFNTYMQPAYMCNENYKLDEVDRKSVV